MAQHYGVSPEAVHGWLIAAGIPRRPPRTPPASGDGDNIVNLYRGGWSGPAIAEQLGCSVATIYRRLDAAGVPRRHVTRRLGRSDLLDGLERGLSAPAIAAAHGVSVSCVCRALAREQLMSRTQAFKRQRRLRYTEFYATGLNPNANVSVSGDAQP